MNSEPVPMSVMSKIKLYQGSAEGDVVNRQRPIIATSTLVGRSHQICAHSHRRGQLLYSVYGDLHVCTPDGRWIVTPDYGLWIPSNERHLITVPGGAGYRSAFVEPHVLAGRFSRTHPVSLPSAFTTLMEQAARTDRGYRANSSESRLHGRLLDRFMVLQQNDFCISLPRHNGLRRIAEQMLDDPTRFTRLQDISCKLGISERHLLRLFQLEVGQSFSQWRQQLLVALAIRRMKAGQSLTRISLDLGYRSPAAFSTMFRRVTGIQPSRYRPR